MPKDFGNWIGMNTASDPSSPTGVKGTEFQDWSNLVGPSDLMKAASGDPTGVAGVAPPSNWTEFAQQAIAPIQQKFNNVSNAASQIGQGNTFGAYSALKGRSTPTALTKPTLNQTQETTTEAPSGGFDFSR
jgi:hypothetical protein